MLAAPEDEVLLVTTLFRNPAEETLLFRRIPKARNIRRSPWSKQSFQGVSSLECFAVTKENDLAEATSSTDDPK
jgi:hypothetical protein